MSRNKSMSLRQADALIARTRRDDLDRYIRTAAVMCVDPGAPRYNLLHPENVASTIMHALLGRPVEHLMVFAVDAGGRIYDQTAVGIGTTENIIIDTRGIARWAITRRHLPVGVILAHNHPVGEAAPSMLDRNLTSRVEKILLGFELILLDHIIVGPTIEWISMRQSGDLHPLALIGGVPSLLPKPRRPRTEK